MLSKARKILVIVFIIGFSLILAWTGSMLRQEEPVEPKEDIIKPVTLKLAHVYGIDHPFSIGMEKLAARVKEKSNGKLIVNTYDSSRLGSEKDIADGVANGIIDMALIGPGELGKRFKPILIFDAPYVFKDLDHMQKVTRGVVGRELWDSLAMQTGIRVLASLYYGTRHVTTSMVTISMPADLQEVKLRTPDQPLSVANVKAMGADPVPMALFEVYLALQQGIVDGQENPLPTIASQRFNEVQKYISLTGHVIQVIPLTISDKKLHSLPKEMKEVLIETINEVAPMINGEIAAKEEVMLEEFRESGMHVIQPDVEAFKKTTASVIKEYEDTWGQGLYERIQNVQ